MSDPTNDLSYPILTPFKFRGAVVKPPMRIQMIATAAREYQDAGVLGAGDVAVLPPKNETDGQSESSASADLSTGAGAPAAVQTPPRAKPATTAAKTATKKATR